jgi:hypothetical protein
VIKSEEAGSLVLQERILRLKVGSGQSQDSPGSSAYKEREAGPLRPALSNNALVAATS